MASVKHVFLAGLVTFGGGCSLLYNPDNLPDRVADAPHVDGHADVAIDQPVDVAIDSSIDSAIDSSIDSSVDAPVDVMIDAAVDMMIDGPPDAPDPVTLTGYVPTTLYEGTGVGSS